MSADGDLEKQMLASSWMVVVTKTTAPPVIARKIFNRVIARAEIECGDAIKQIIREETRKANEE